MPEEFDRFADELDRMAAGQPPAGDNDLAAFAREVQGIGAERIDDEQRDRIRRRLMQHANSAATPTTGGAGPLSQPTLTDPAMTNPWVRRIPTTTTPSGWSGHMVKAQTAIAIMTAVALLIVSAAWYTNQQGGDDPNPMTTRYAAAPTEDTSGIGNGPAMLGMDERGTQVPINAGTPETGGPFDWTMPIDASECRDYRQSPPSERIRNIRGERQEFPERQYAPFSLPTEKDAVEVAATARLSTACYFDSQGWLFRSDRWFYENDNPNLPDEHAFDREDQLATGMEVSAAFANYPVTDFVIQVEEPLDTMTVPLQGQAYQPQHVVQLADGRLVVPATVLVYVDPDGNVSEDWPFRSTEEWPYTLSVAFVFAQQDDGAWLLDEELLFCVGECDAAWEDAAEDFGISPVPEVPEVTPVEHREPWDAALPVVEMPQTLAPPASTETADVPAATPVAVNDWSMPITAEECTSRDARTDAEREELATGSPEFPERLYGPFTTPSMRDATDAATTLRQFEACRLSGSDADGYVSDRFVYERTNPAQQRSSAEDNAARAQALQEISAAYQDVAPTDFLIFADGPVSTPPVSTTIQETPGVFQPVHARQLADGRIALPPSQIAPEAMPPDGLPAYIGTVYIVSDADGLWLVDEMLPFCVGECDEFWQEMGPMPEPDAIPAVTPQTTTDESSPLTEMLAVLPAPLSIMEGNVLPEWGYADIDQRFEDLGLTDEQLADDPRLPLATNAYAPLVHTTSLFDLAADEAFVKAIGFNPLTVDQVLVTGRAPDVLTLLRGEWDEEALIAAWEAAGYTEYATVHGVTIWSLDPEGMVDPQHPIQARMFQQLNNVAILDGGILAYAGYASTIEMVIATQSGEMASALDDPWLEPLFAAVPAGTVSSIGFTQPGSTLYDLGQIATNPNISADDQAVIEDQLRTSREAVGPMPEYRGVVFAVEGDPAEDGEVVVRLRAFSDEEAGQIIRVFEWRCQNFTSARYQQTFDSIMPLVSASADGDIVTLRFDPQGASAMWLELLQGGDLLVFAVDAGLPVGTPEASPVTSEAIPEEDAEWWTWPSGEECRPDEIPEDMLDSADYPERAYLPLGTPDREDAENAALVARTTVACQVHFSTPPFSSSRYQAENYVLGEDPYDYGQTLLEQNENGRAISEAFPITDPTQFGRLTFEEPSHATPPGFETGRLAQPMYEPYTVVFIPSQAVQLADGRIAIPESLLGMEEDAELAYRGDPATWVRHYALLVVLSDASGTWHIDEILPFCIGPDCDLFWEQNQEIAYRVLAGATPEAPMETPTSTPEAIVPVDERIWLACPDYTGPYTYAARDGVTSDVAPFGAFDPRSSWGPAEPPSIPCDYPEPEPPEIGNPILLD